jgi:hypothetical protein
MERTKEAIASGDQEKDRSLQNEVTQAACQTQISAFLPAFPRYMLPKTFFAAFNILTPRQLSQPETKCLLTFDPAMALSFGSQNRRL